VADSGPLEGENPFEGLPLFGDLAKMLGQEGSVSWAAAGQLAMSIATEGDSEANVDPMARIALEELARVADLNVAQATGLSTSTTGIKVAGVTRTQWVQRSLDAYKPRFERLAQSLGEVEDPDDGGEPDEAMSEGALLGGLMKMMTPMMLGVTAGSMIGHLARRSFGQYDLPIPRPPGDELMLIVANIDEFGAEWSLPTDDLRLWVCLHELAHHAVLNVAEVRTRLLTLLDEFAGGFAADGSGLESKLAELDPTDAQSLEGIQSMLGDPEVLLGVIQTPAQEATLAHLEALVAVIVGYVDHTMDEIGEGLISSYAMVTEAVRRRRVSEDPSNRFVERLLGLEMGQATYDRGAAFIGGVVERVGASGLARLWTSPDHLPTPAEVDAPGLWLARIDLPDAAPPA